MDEPFCRDNGTVPFAESRENYGFRSLNAYEEQSRSGPL